MIYRTAALPLLAIAWLTAIPVGAQDAEQLEAAELKSRLNSMASLIGAIQIREQIDGRDSELECSAQPVTRFTDDARQFQDGSLWAFTRNQRPIALIKCSTKDSRSGRWWHACTSLSSNPLQATQSGRIVWTPREPGIEYHAVPDSPPPASTSTRRRLQLRQLARRFSAHQFWNPDNQRFELRLSPRPVLVYSDETTGVIEGGLFVFTHGVTPALVVMIEAIGGPQTVSWRYAIAKHGSAEFHVSLDGTGVYHSPRAAGVSGRPADPYYLFSSLADGTQRSPSP